MKYIDLFSGAGGLSLGLKKAGGELIYSNEIDEAASQTQRHNLEFLNDDPKKVISCSIEELHNKIIRKKIKFSFQSKVIVKHDSINDTYKNRSHLDLSDLDRVRKTDSVDLLAGGPPCQGFSNAGKGTKSFIKQNVKDYIDDPRNQLFKYFLNFAEYHSPKIVLIENVKGLSSSSNYRNLIQQSLGKVKPGYITISLILNSHHFGVPQNRERIFFIGIRKDIIDAEKFIFYLPSILANYRTDRFVLKDAIDDLPKIRSNPKSNNVKIENEIPIGNIDSFGEDVSTKQYNNLIKSTTKYSTLINSFKGENILPQKLFNHKCRFNNDLDLKIYSLMKAGKYLDNIQNFDAVQHITYGTTKVDGINKYQSSFKDKYFKLDPNKPSKTITAHLIRDNNGYIHYGETPRGISIREAARIQSFPDWFQFKGAFTKQFKQIGNAVPPLLAEALGNIFNTFLKEGIEKTIDLNNKP